MLSAATLGAFPGQPDVHRLAVGLQLDIPKPDRFDAGHSESKHKRLVL
jgi:hypothetical protein